ncbi:TPA: hypothetical protein IHJ63_000599 [Escherichia coli]|uniref:Phage protein n=1 Tax=Scandinavium lactucae TaxID=3095028 RepID=A0ABU4QU32_9ENTR|nr:MULTISPECIES: hypothetical protein [unclassified Scandinavium]HAO1978108.1 hypothetical protein [Escherichia coli]MDX6042798.1 hypothetical protein [Scandinavium sp. V105_6]MDX6052799.1 hypothetical protein [Scandinavium sp. V105_1]HAO1992434.1 hypothetical protein [Escherichia coli]HAO2025111.1 hypothetical protein [Escherichia coli]
MNLNQLMKKLQPVLQPYEVEGETIYIHRPNGRDFAKCTDVAQTLILCAKDENGDPIFSDEDIDGRINVNSIDFVIQNEIYAAIIKLVNDSNPTDEVEKK